MIRRIFVGALAASLRLMMWIPVPAVFWSELLGKRANIDHVEVSGALEKMVVSMRYWASVEAGDRPRLAAVESDLRAIADQNPKSVRLALKRRMSSLAPNDPERGLFQLNLYVLNRYMFAVPDGDNGAGIFPWSKDQSGCLSLVGWCHGWAGGLIMDLSEFDASWKRYGLRTSRSINGARHDGGGC